MPSALWPATLPNPNASGYSVTPVDPARRTDMEVGAARTRRITKARNDRVQASWSFTDAQMAIFRGWWDADDGAAGGAAWFSNSLPLGNGGYEAVEARFIGGYKEDSTGYDSWNVSGQLEIR